MSTTTGLSLDAPPAAAADTMPIKRRKTRAAPAAPVARALPMAAADDAAAMADDPAIVVRTMADLARDFPHVRMDSTCEHATTKLVAAVEMLAPLLQQEANKRKRDAAGDLRSIATAAAAAAAGDLSPHKKDLDQVQSRSVHFSASQAEPLEFILMQRARAALPIPDRRFEDVLHTHKDASSILRRPTSGRALPLFTAAHETNLLRFQAGTFDLPCGRRTFPPCWFGIHCVGRSPREIPGLTQPITLMRAMTPEEYYALVSTNAQPVGQMPCVLCGRFTLTQAVLIQRHGLRPALASQLQVAEPDSVLQLWSNLDNEPGGYFRRYVFHALSGEIAIEPIANYHPSLLRAAFDPKLQTWRIDQEIMVWKPARLLPRDIVGETVQDF